MNNKIKKIASSILLLTVTLYSFPIYALTKDETVYTKLNSDGSIKNTVVNTHLNNTEKQNMLNDETELLNILNINGNEKFTLEGTKLIWESKENDIFYQGSTDKPLPITPSIKYFLNDEEKSLNEILGKNGKITIKMSFTNNEMHSVFVNGKNETLYTPFVVTTAFILKGNTNKDITVNNGKVINNGKDYIVAGLSTPSLYKSLNIDVLQKLEEITINFVTSKFELPNIYIVSTPKVLSEEDMSIFNKMNELYTSVSTLKTSIDEIETGSNELLTGASKINEGNKKVYETLEMITSKVSELNSGAYSLNQGIKYLVENLNNLSLPENFNPSDIPNLITANETAISVLTSLNENNKYDNVIIGLNKENELLEKLISDILPSLNKLQSQKESLEMLSSGSEQILDGTSSLKEGLELLTSITKELSTGTSNLYEGLNTLNNGINNYNNEGITKINNYVNGNIKSTENKIKALVKLGNEYENLGGNNSNAINNTKFIMNIDSVKAPNNTKTTLKETTTSKSFWDKLKDLFK